MVTVAFLRVTGRRDLGWLCLVFRLAQIRIKQLVCQSRRAQREMLAAEHAHSAVLTATAKQSANRQMAEKVGSCTDFRELLQLHPPVSSTTA